MATTGRSTCARSTRRIANSAKLAARAKPRTLVLYHVVRMRGTDAELFDGVRAGGYTGDVVIGRDLDRY